MGMFDTVHFLCPKCKSKITRQTKSGKCELKNYHQTNVPIEAANDLLGIEIKCPNCNEEFIINGNILRTPLSLVSINGDLYD